MKNHTVAVLLLAEAVFSTPAWAQFQPEIQYNTTQTTNNIANTGNDLARAYDYSTWRSQQRLNSLLSGDGVTGVVNHVVDEGTDAIAGAVDGVIDDATDTVMAPIEDAVAGVSQTISCNVIGAGLSAAAGGVSAVFSGGKSTFGMQAAQWLTQQSSNLCQGKQLATEKLQLATERRLLDYDRRNTANGTADNAAGIDSMMTRTLPGLGQAGFLSSEAQVEDAYQSLYPDLFAPMPFTELMAKDSQWANVERTTRMNALSLQNRAVQEQASGLGRAVGYAAAGRKGEGIRAELQAGNAIQGEQIAAINALTATTVAGQRARLNERLRAEATRKAANAASEDFMASLASCANCTIDQPFLKE